MRQIKIAYILPISHRKGGAEVLVARLAEESMRRSFQTHVFSICGKPPAEELKKYEKSGIICHYFDKQRLGFSLIAAVWLIAKLCLVRPDIVHSHLHVSKYLILSRLFFLRAVWMHTIHSLPEKDAPGMERVFNKIAAFLGMRLVAISDDLSKLTSLYYGVRVSFVTNGVDIPELAATNRSPVRVFGCVARLSVEKNIGMLIAAYCQLEKEFPGVELIVAGDGPEKESLIRQCESLGVKSKVKFLGAIDDPYAFLRGVHAFVLSSKYEGAPLSILEAMASKVPVIAPAVGMIPEMLDNGRCGIVYEAGNLEALKDSMQWVMENCSDDLIDSAHSRCLEKYSIASTFDGYMKIARLRL